jgi:hypothetical protein
MWNIYWEANRVGWQMYFDPWKLLQPSYYVDVFLVGNLSEILGRFLTLGLLAVLGRSIPWAWQKRKANPEVAAVLGLSIAFLGESIIGSHGMHSMVRYLVPIELLWFPLWALRFQERGSHKWKEPSLRMALSVAALLLLFAIQVVFMLRYSRAEWVS